MAIQYLKQTDSNEHKPLIRRGFQLGWVSEDKRPAMPAHADIVSLWQQDKACMLPALLSVKEWQADIEQSHQLMQSTLSSGEITPSLDLPPYTDRLADQFPLVASSMEEHDEQAIEKVYFDAVAVDSDGAALAQNDQALAEDLWCKASWLSFLEDDASLRFRFSFGMECLEDVAADPVRQLWAGKLCDALFPESAALTQNAQLQPLLHDMLDGAAAFVERIVYFNAPGGGAQMHHDVERGHDGVVYAQLSGSTFWLALTKPTLMDELINFANNPEHTADIASVIPSQSDQASLHQLLQDQTRLADYLDENDHELVEAIMDRCPAFIEYLITQGFAYILHAGDVLLMPQRDLETCVWHSVCCLGDEPGEAVSFAIRKEAHA